MVPQHPDEIASAALARLIALDGRLARDAASLAASPHADGVARVEALRRAADELRAELAHGDANPERSDP